MAKGDKSKVQNQVNTQTQTAQNNLNRVNNDVINPVTQNAIGNYNQGTNQSLTDYSNIMSGLGNFKPTAINPVKFNPISASTVNYSTPGNITESLGNYKNFIDTGGLSDADQANLRARGVSPIRAVYGNAINDVDRGRALAGGYSPNYIAARANLARGLSSGIADQTQNVNAQIAQMVQQGKEFGTSGFGQLSDADASRILSAATTNANAQNNASSINAQGELSANQANAQILSDQDKERLAALQAQTSLYGTNPALAATFGNQVNQAVNNNLEGQTDQNQIGQLGINGQIGVAQTPSNFESTLGNIGKIANIAGGVGGALTGAFGNGYLRTNQ